MKKLKSSLLLIFMLASFTIMNGQEKIESQEALLTKNISNTKLVSGKNSIKTDKNNTKKVTVSKNTINSSDKKTHKINFAGIDYYIIDGIWHTKFKNKFILKQAPKGARLKFIPKGGALVTMGGIKYYKSHGVFYKKVKGGFYEVARP